jgi:DNA-binding ferritin-like protein (Dps family)
VKPIKPFAEYIENGLVRKQQPDISRAQSLRMQAQDSYKNIQEMLMKIGLHERNASDVIKNAYDVIMELVRAHMLTKGFYAQGPENNRILRSRSRFCEPTEIFS